MRNVRKTTTHPPSKKAFQERAAFRGAVLASRSTYLNQGFIVPGLPAGSWCFPFPASKREAARFPLH